jgi:hypothetical protein
MALTFTAATNAQRPKNVLGDLAAVFRTVTFDSSYPTGGEAITAADFGLQTIVWVSVNALSDVATKHVRWDPTAGTLMILIEDGTSGISAEAANASDQSAVDAQVLVLGY